MSDNTPNITIIIPTSPIPSHPSPRLIATAISSIREQLPDASIHVYADGYPEDSTYRDYLDSLIHRGIADAVTEFDSHVHQSGMLTAALLDATTPLILYWEHDWSLLPGVPWPELSALILSGEFHSIKLHAYPRINVYHEHLMDQRVMCQNGVLYDRYYDALGGLAVPIIKTRQWSQNPHLASTQFYRDKILPLCRDKCGFIEEIVHGVVAHSPWEEFRCGIFNPADGDMIRIYHLDGKHTGL